MAVWTQLEKSSTSFHDISLHGVVSLRIQLQVACHRYPTTLTPVSVRLETGHNAVKNDVSVILRNWIDSRNGYWRTAID